MTRKNVLVTGVSRGIGTAICERLIADGYYVLGTYNQSEREAQALKERVGSLELFRTDFSRRDQTLALIEQLSKVALAGIVNNAGMIEFEEFANFDMAIWDRTIEVNLNAPLLLSVRLGCRMGPGGSIVNVASADGLIGSFCSMSYSASKAALLNLTKSLANNLGRKGVRVNAVAPGWINTGMSTPESNEAANIAPLGRNGLPGDVAAAVSFLLSREADFITGATVVIDGGYTNVDYIMLRESQGKAERASAAVHVTS